MTKLAPAVLGAAAMAAAGSIAWATIPDAGDVFHARVKKKRSGLPDRHRDGRDVQGDRPAGS